MLPSMSLSFTRPPRSYHWTQVVRLQCNRLHRKRAGMVRAQAGRSPDEATSLPVTALRAHEAGIEGERCGGSDPQLGEIWMGGIK